MTCAYAYGNWPVYCRIVAGDEIVCGAEWSPRCRTPTAASISALAADETPIPTNIK